MDAATFGADVVEAVRSFLEQEVDPLLVKIAALEAEVGRLKALPAAPTETDLDKLIKAEVLVQLAERKIKEADERLAAGPQPDFKALLAEAVAAIPPAEKGKDADPELVASLVKEEAERILAGWEKPKDGKDGAQGEKGADGAPGRDGVDGKDGLNGKDGAPGLNGKDGIDAVDVVVDREGQLVFTMSDGRMKNVGLVVGKDGEPGRDGANGADGKDGVDGIGFDDLDLIENDAGVFLRCVRGENVKEWRLPVMRYRGVFKDGEVYRKGDTVTWGGSLWHCDADGTDDKPDGATKSWTLASKRGRDGKDGIMKPAPKSGPVKVS